MSIQDALASLYDWAKHEDFVGHDPHDLLASPVFDTIRSNPDSEFQRFARLVALQFGRRSFLDLRTFLQVPRGENAKALALFLVGLLRAKNAANATWEHDAHELADRLLTLMEEDGWGYPFPWQSRTHYLPARFPNIVTTSFVATALIEWHAISPSPTVLDAILRAAEYVLALRIPGRTDVAFGYSKNDSQIVFNASVLGAEFLLRAGQLLNENGFIELAHDATRFVANNQREDGGWSYGLERSQGWTDSFHTGFTIRAIESMARATHNSELLESARRGFDFYRRTFLEPDFAVRYFPDRRYPIDAHALGEAMLTFEAFGEHNTANEIAQWSIHHMRSPSGYFYYQRHRLFTNRIPYIRWSNAWMFRGMAEVVSSMV